MTDIYAQHCTAEAETTENARDRFGTWSLAPFTPVHLADCAERALERDYYMTAQEALKFGIVDKIVDKRPVQAVST